MSSTRVIFHSDCNAFFASCEERMNPSLRDVPMAVAGDPEKKHGIILAKNEKAKKYGIVTAETVYSAFRKCPSLVTVPPHHEEYMRISKKINEIYLDYTDLVEPFSIDESYLDVTGSLALFGMPAEQLADTIRLRIQKEIGVTVSIGVSFCKVFAKMGSEYKKPNATTCITADNIDEILYGQPVGNFLFVGASTADKLKKAGIYTIGDLAKASPMQLSHLLGKQGLSLWQAANGQDEDPVRSYFEKREVKSVGNSMTFSRDLTALSEIKSALSALSASVAVRLREENKKCTCVQVQIRDHDFKTISRRKTLMQPTWLQREITDVAVELVLANWSIGKPIRLLGVTAAELFNADEAYLQGSLFGEAERSERQEKIEDTMSVLRKKYGKAVVSFGHSTHEDLGLSDFNEGRKKRD
ncbi:MAG: DNA polymerase IV [Ruminococcaceae bacterium]|nr:DNA polymerase IV [Oscillospiraceae bacterium]